MAKKRPRRRWGSGAVYQRASDKRWIAAVRGDDGKRRVKYARTEQEAKDLLPGLRREVASGKRPTDRRITVGAILLTWLGNRQGSIAPSSYVRYEELVRLQLADLAGRRLADLEAEDVRAHLRALLHDGAAPATVRGVLRILRSAITLAESDGLIERNVARFAAPPRLPRTRGRALSVDEAQRLLRAATDDPLYALWALMLGTGLRMGEALGLRWSDIDLVAGSVSVTGSLRHQSPSTRGAGPRLQRVEPKTAAGRRTVALPAFALRPLRELPMDAVYVFHRGHGRPLNPSTVQRSFAVLVARAKLPPMRLHDLRHTAATVLLANGASLDDVKRMLGHTSIQVTSDIYGHLVEGRSRELAAALDRVVG